MSLFGSGLKPSPAGRKLAPAQAPLHACPPLGAPLLAGHRVCVVTLKHLREL
jgi:hypothetical protein